MDALYPNLHDRFKSEGVCPICLMEMELAPRYACENGHTICYRCKPYYYACPTCRSPLNIESPPARDDSSYMPVPPPTHYMPHPLPPNYHHHHNSGNPTAPPGDDGEDFINHERHTWRPVEPTENQELVACPFSHLGCWVKFPIHLQELHESRCQFRPNLEEETLPTDLHFGQDDLVDCCYQPSGCNMRIPPWRKHVHEKYCYYKDKYDAMSNVSEALGAVTIADEYSNQRYSDNEQDSEELVECRYAMYGCKVRIYGSRRYNHESKCNYQQYGNGVEEDDYYVRDEPELDPDELVPCRWSEYGCRVKPKRCRKEDHEEKCNYRMEECVYKDYGCETILNPSNRFAHERICEFAC